MKSGPTYNVQFRRKRDQKTDYKKRLAMLKSETLRFIVRISNTLVRAQLVDYKEAGDVTLLSITSTELKKFGWKYSLKNTPAIYLTSLLLCKKIKEKNIKKIIFDTGLKNYKSGSKIYAALKAIVDFKEIECPHNEKAFPLVSRIEGKHISESAKNDLNKSFIEIKEKILN